MESALTVVALLELLKSPAHIRKLPRRSKDILTTGSAVEKASFSCQCRMKSARISSTSSSEPDGGCRVTCNRSALRATVPQFSRSNKRAGAIGQHSDRFRPSPPTAAMSYQHPTASWEAMGDGSVFYRKHAVYEMQWQGIHDISEYILEGARHGGPIGELIRTIHVVS